MEQGGAIFWKQYFVIDDNHDQDIEAWPGQDEHELVMNAQVKYATLYSVWKPLGQVLGIPFSSFEQDDVSNDKLPLVLDQIEKALSSEKDDEVKKWLIAAQAFFKEAYELGKDITVCL